MKIIQLHKNEKHLLSGLKANRRDAQQELYTIYAPKMLSVCRQYIKDVHHAEEVMLSGFMKIFSKLETYKSKGSFEGWIRRIMINDCISFLRLKKRMVFIDDDAYFEQEIEMEFNEEENVSQLQQLVDGLREDLRVVFNLYVVEEFKHKEISDYLNISENASKLRYKRAKELLKKQYNNLTFKSYGQ